MWYIFPQLVGLGKSERARRFALPSREAAQDYLAHDLLGPRLIACTRATLQWRNRTANEIFKSPDDLKFHASLTLFRAAQPDERLFAEGLDVFFDGAEHEATLRRLYSTPS